jgi:hypothetical protein
METMHGQSDLSHVIGTAQSARPFARSLDRTQQKADKYPNDRNDNDQLNKRKAIGLSECVPSHHAPTAGKSLGQLIGRKRFTSV